MNIEQAEQIKNEYYQRSNDGTAQKCAVKNFRQIRAKFYHETEKTRAKIKIYEPSRFSGDERHKHKMKVWINSEMNTTIQAWDYLRKKGFNIVGRANDREETIFFCDNWAENFIEVNGDRRDF
jgi:hypothetical protein